MKFYTGAIAGGALLLSGSIYKIIEYSAEFSSVNTPEVTSYENLNYILKRIDYSDSPALNDVRGTLINERDILYQKNSEKIDKKSEISDRSPIIAGAFAAGLLLLIAGLKSFRDNNEPRYY